MRAAAESAQGPIAGRPLAISHGITMFVSVRVGA